MARSPCVRSGQDCKDKVIKVIILNTVDFHLSHVGCEVRQEVAKCPMIAADTKLDQEGSKHREKASPRPPHCCGVTGQVEVDHNQVSYEPGKRCRL